MTYRINGVAFLMQPTEGNWTPQQALGDDGTGHPIYADVAEFEMVFNAIDVADYRQVQVWQESMGTGTVYAELPAYNATANDVFQVYTGTIIRMPERGKYFQGYVLNCKVVISNVRVR